jgi:hypothetical protein
MKKLLSIISLVFIASFASAERAFQLSLTPDIALVPRGETVKGLALNVWGENEVRGINLGFVNGMVGNGVGFSYSLIGTYAESYRGVIWGGFFTHTSGDVVGWQSGLVNISAGTFVGLQTGFLNTAKDAKGLQLGFINYAENLHGVQIGLANIVRSNPWFSELPQNLATGFPFVNWSF